MTTPTRAKPGGSGQAVRGPVLWGGLVFVAKTPWWPPFCATVDLLVAVVLVVEIAAGVNFHQ